MREAADQREVVRRRSCRSRCPDRRGCARAGCRPPRRRRPAPRGSRRRRAARRRRRARPASSSGRPAHASGRPAGRTPAASGEARRVVGQRRDVVEEVGAGVEGGPRHRGVAGVDRDRQREALGAQRRDHRDDARRSPPPPAPGRRRAGSTRRRCRGCRRPPRRAPAPGRAPAAGARCAPPSEKLSGVTFSTPISRGRSRARPQTGARGAVRRAAIAGGSAAARHAAAARRRGGARRPRRTRAGRRRAARAPAGRGPPLRDDRPVADAHAGGFGSGHAAFHLIEQPIAGICSRGPWPVSAICRIASKSSRRAPGCGLAPLSSSRPRYCSFSSELKPKKSGVQAAP